jgi:hypothetical protein
MNFSTTRDYRAHATEARAGVTDHSDLYVLFFGLRGVIVALTVLLMN